jgi:HK97 family phage major capsid protein
MEEKVIAKLDEMISKGEANKTALEQKFSQEIEGVKTEAKTSVEEVKGSIKVVKDEVDAVKEQVTEMMKKNGRLKAGNGSQKFSDILGEQLEAKSASLKNYSANNRQAVNLEIKAVADMASGHLTTSGTETFSGNVQLGGVGRKPYEVSHIRDFVRVVPIGTDSAFVIRDAAGEGGPTAVAMGAVKPQSDRDYVKLIQPVTKIAHYFKIPEEMLGDNAWLQNEISSVGVEELLSKEDDLVLNQAAAAGLFAGLTTATNSTAFAAPASLALAIEGANNYDVLMAAWTQLRNLKVGANYILCNPSDYSRMILSKATTGEYVFGAPNVSIPNLFGIPIIPHTAITSDKFLIGDFSKVTIGQRAGVSVRFYDQNEDDAIYNMVTVVIEERLTVVADRADRLVYGDFSDARAALETA